MFIPMLSVITSVKDYVEIVHKLIEYDSTNQLQTYYDLGPMLTYAILTTKQFFFDLVTLNWLQNLWSLPTLIPNIASSMISEISVLDGYFHNAFTFLEKPISYGDRNLILYCLEKFTIGLINSIFLCLPTSIAHLICLRRFVMQGLEAGYIAGLGTIAGNLLWIGSIIFGLRFLMIPWLSLDILRYLLGFILLVKYMWDSYTERRGVLEDLSKSKIFLLNFLLAFTEQTSIYPFVSNLTMSSDSTLLESFPTNSFLGFMAIHGCYLSGICLGSLSLLQLTCWFWENPAFNFYIWMISSFKVTTGAYYKLLNFVFLYATMICAISSITYFGLDYTLTNPLGLVHEDRLVDQKTLLETSFLSTKASDRNTRRNRGRHGRRERWKRRVRRYRTFDASLYDQGIYDLFTIEDLNYGFDRFWLRRKIRNHRVRFRFFPGPWMRSFKKQLARPRLESFMGPRVEFFRILFEQVYHPEFHEFRDRRTFLANPSTSKTTMTEKNLSKMSNKSAFDKDSIEKSIRSNDDIFPALVRVHSNKLTSIYSDKSEKYRTQGLIKQFSALRKFVRKVNSRVKASDILLESKISQQTRSDSVTNSVKPIYSKRWKQIFSRISHDFNNRSLHQQENLFRRLYDRVLMRNPSTEKLISSSLSARKNSHADKSDGFFTLNLFSNSSKKEDIKQRLSKKDVQILRYKTFLKQNSTLINEKDFPSAISFDSTHRNQTFENLDSEKNSCKNMTLLHPIKFYLQKERAFQRKLKFYGANVFRNFGIENNAAYFRIMMKRFFYYYKPTLRWERTMRTATMRKARRKRSRIPRKMNLSKKIQGLSTFDANDDAFLLAPNTTQELSLKNVAPNFGSIQRPTHFYSLVNKRASRYRYQIYKDVLQHWYYTPFNRLLLKFDVDSFIRRQPAAYFLTKKEENLLHFRRFLLSEYYDTLRWYTYMQHYGSMKARIGGTKSFANRVYNQQFMGTLKKIRHLFAITPSSTETNVLKFDQPLYNEFANNRTRPILNESVIHEELLADDFMYTTEVTSGNDLKNQSALVIRQYLVNAKPIRENFIKKLLSEKNYWELTRFLFKGQKIRGTNSVTNEREFITQETHSLYTHEEKQRFDNDQRRKFEEFFQSSLSNFEKTAENKNLHRSSNSISTNTASTFDSSVSGAFGVLDANSNPEANLWLTLIKKCQNQLYNQESLKLYLSRHIEKHNRQKQRREKVIKVRLQRMKNWLISQKQTTILEGEMADLARISKESRSPVSQIGGISFSAFDRTKERFDSEKQTHISGLTTAFQKAIKEAIYFQKEWSPIRMNIRNNRPQINWAIVNSSLKEKLAPSSNQNLSRNAERSILISGNSRKSENLKNHLKIRLKLHQMQLGKIENDLRKSVVSASKKSFDKRSMRISYLLKTTFTPFKKIYENSLNPIISKFIDETNRLFRSNSDEDLAAWRKLEMGSNKRKKIRKTLKRLKNKNLNAKKEGFWSTRDLSRYEVRKNTNDLLREKRDASSPFILENKRHIKSWEKWREKFSTFSSFGESATRIRDAGMSASKNEISSLQAERLDETKTTRNRFNIFEFVRRIMTKKFKRKRSRLRRSRRLKARGPIKKRTLGEKLKRQFKLLKKYGSNDDDPIISEKLERQHKKLEIFKMITKRTYKAENAFQMKDTKQRRTRQRKHRFWKKHKKPKYAQNRRKQRKRRRYAIGKIRTLNKELKRVKSNAKLKKWWWENFLPNFKASADAIWQIENDLRVQKQLAKLSFSEILDRDRFTATNPFTKTLQIGDKDYKPLAIPEALRIRERLARNKLLNFGNSSESPTSTIKKIGEGVIGQDSSKTTINSIDHDINNLEKLTHSADGQSSEIEALKNKDLDLIGRISQNSLISNDQNKKVLDPTSDAGQIAPNTQKLAGINPIPFYAGWDESLRQFVVTNRLLCNKKAGYTMNLVDETRMFPMSDKKVHSKSDIHELSDSEYTKQTAFHKLFKTFSSTNLQFSQAPLQGMNAATTLYWQVPFTTYDPDQFFALGMDGFSPIGWRKFHFRRSKQTIKPILVKTKTIGSSQLISPLRSNMNKKISSEPSDKLSYNIQLKIFENRFKDKNHMIFAAGIEHQNSPEAKTSQKNIYRRSQKRYKRVKKHPRPPVWFPSGPLTNQVLPVHYIYVFYKRARLPRDRYIRRRLRKDKDGTLLSIRSTLTKMTDMTLRRRSKSRRKYHRKPSRDAALRASGFGNNAIQSENLLLRRRQFKAFPHEASRSRPLAENQARRDEIFQNDQSMTKSKSKKRRKSSITKQPSENLRIRQLRRRIQRQVIRPIWRYRPRAGGFVWPGDYLRLENVRAPRLNPNKRILELKNDNRSNEPKRIDKQRKLRKKKRRLIQEWQIQPKKYLLQKHNCLVLKKRLEKSQNSHKINHKVNELKYLFKNQ